MWQTCRVAALKRLMRVPRATGLSSLRAVVSDANPALRLSRTAVQPQWAVSTAVHQFSTTATSTRSQEQPLLINGVALHDLAKRSRYDLEKQFGADVITKASRALPQTWSNLLAQHNGGGDEHSDVPVSRELAKQIFLAAQRQKLPQLALSVFGYMDVTFPKQVDFVIYGEVFTLLTRTGKSEQILAIYERNKPLYSEDRPPPELIYRFGVYAKLGQKDFDGVQALVEEMSRFGIALSNELKTRIMVAYAKAGKKDEVLELFQSLDPQVGRWHEADVDRVVNSMGLIRSPDEAFEFYRNAQIKLSGNTILALLNVCRENDRPKHAMAILANRKRFNLVLNTREYNKVMEALESFHEQKEIGPILDEMQENGVRFDKLTKLIIARNQNFLQGTVYGSKTADAVDGIKLSQQDGRRKMQEFNAAKAFPMAAGLADMYVTPLTSKSEDIVSNDEVTQTHFVEGAMIVPPRLANEAVVAYSNNGEHHKVKGLLRGFSAVQGDFGHALTHIIAFYSKKGDHEMVYKAFKAVQYQGRDIFRIKEALDRFLQFADTEATMTLFYQAFQQIAAALETNGNDFAKLKRAISFDRVNLVKMTLQVLVENKKLDHVVEVFDHLASQKFHVRAGDYSTVFRLMREENQSYRANDFEKMWDDMAGRGIIPSKAILAHSCVAFSTGKESHQKRLLDAYAQVKDLEDDTYSLPPQCYSTLLDAAAKFGTLADVQALFDDAVRNHQEAKKRNAKIKFYPRDWVATLVSRLAAAGESDAAFDHITKMKKKCGGYSYEAVVTAIRACAAADARNPEQINQLKQIFVDSKFRLSVLDAEELVRIAKQQGSHETALLAIQLFERGNLAVTSPEATSEGAKRAFRLQKSPSVQVLAKLQAIYETASALSEQHGDEKMSAFLKERVREIAALH